MANKIEGGSNTGNGQADKPANDYSTAASRRLNKLNGDNSAQGLYKSNGTSNSSLNSGSTSASNRLSADNSQLGRRTNDYTSGRGQKNKLGSGNEATYGPPGSANNNRNQITSPGGGWGSGNDNSQAARPVNDYSTPGSRGQDKFYGSPVPQPYDSDSDSASNRLSADNSQLGRRTNDYTSGGGNNSKKNGQDDLDERAMGSPSTNEDGDDENDEDDGPDEKDRIGRGRTDAQDKESSQLNNLSGPDKPGDEGKKGGLKERIKSLGKKHGKKIWFAGAGLGGGMLVLLLILFVLGSLLLPHFFQNIVGYRFANAARSYRQANNQVTSKKILLDSANDTKWNQTKDRYQKLKSWALLEKYRPAAIVRNMEATGKLDFEYAPRKNPLARAKLTAIIVNGERIPVEQRSKWGIPFSKAGNNIRLAQGIDDALYKSLRGSHVGAQVLRTSVGAKILERIGYRTFYAWAGKAKNYQGVTQKDADRLQLKEMAARVQGNNERGSPTTPATKRATDATKEAAAAALEDKAQVDEIIDTGQQSNKVVAAMNNALQDTKLETVTRHLSTAAAVAIPFCMIIDGSVESSGPLIDANAAAAQRQFLYLGSAAHQQQSGETAAAAVAALNRKLNGEGGVARSNAMGLSSGAPINTDNTLSPYASAMGDFSLMNVILGKLFGEGGNTVANQINKVLVPGCDIVTSVGFTVTTGVAELVVGFFTGGSTEAGLRAGTAVMSRVVAEYLRGFAAKLISKQSLKKMVVQGGAIAGATLLARMLVSNYSGQYYNGLAKDDELANEIDAGAEANANEVGRALGGRPLTSEESIVTRAKSREANAVQQQSLSPFERYFALTNSQSLLTKVGYTVMGNANRSFFANLLTSASQLFNPMAVMGMFSKVTPSVSAAQALDEASYTRTVMGWSEEELALVEEKETYNDFLENGLILEESGKLADIEKKFGQCRDDSVGTLFSEGKIVREENGTPDPKQGACAPEKLGPHNKEFGDLVFRWRLDMRATSVLTLGNDIAEPTQ
jgi:hypothetical protein